MGQDREDGEDDDPSVTAEAVPLPRPFRREIREAVRYERGLVIKALMVLAVVAIVIVLHTLYFT
jgi:hypothetical protein